VFGIRIAQRRQILVSHVFHSRALD
jgi:hypothetical protein